MGVSTNAILFYGYCWDDEAHSPWEVDQTDDDNDEDDDEEDDDESDNEEDENDWEARYARLKGCLPPSTPFPERTVTPTRQNNYSSTPTDYTAAEKAIIEQHKAYWEAKRKIIEDAPCVVDSHCMASCPMPYVAVKTSVVVSNRGYPSVITSIAVDPTWDAALAEFCKALEIKIGKKKPGWWLVSDWSE